MVDILAKDYDVCARFNGGSNAGHTIVADGHKYAFHLLPCFKCLLGHFLRTLEYIEASVDKVLWLFLRGYRAFTQDFSGDAHFIKTFF